jgi:hypothetical protein
MTLSRTDLLTASPGAVSCDLAGEVVVLNMDSGKYFALNAVGGQVWQWLQEPCTIESLQERLLQEYDVTPEQCESEVNSLLRKLSEHGLLQS